jgi:hypothetical protein
MTSMALGVNLGGASTSNAVYPFINIVRNMSPWQPKSTNTGTFWQHQGELIASNPTDKFFAYLSDSGRGLPQGRFSVINPNGKIGLGAFNEYTNPRYTLAEPTDIAGYFTAPEFEFDWPGTHNPASGLYVMAEGSVSGLEIITPGCLPLRNAGEIFHPDYVAFQQGLGALSPMRFMIWTGTNLTVEEHWSDRSLVERMSFQNAGVRVVPWEIVIATANRFGRDPWINMPYRATEEYAYELGKLFAYTLDPRLKVLLEKSNEPWNNFGDFASATAWFTYLYHTRILAAVDAATGIVTKVGHNLVDEDILQCWATRAARMAGIDDSDGPSGSYKTTRGTSPMYVERIDADRFKLWDEPIGNVNRSPAVWAPGRTDLIYVVKNEPGKRIDLDRNYADTSLRDWKAFDRAFSSRVKAIMGSQASGASRTATRMSVTEAALRTNSVAIAPYHYGCWFGGQVDVAVGGTITPKVWSNAGSSDQSGSVTAHFGLYAAGATPTPAEVMLGTGAGFVARTTPWTQTYANANYTAATPITGVPDGNYKGFEVVIDPNGFIWMMPCDITVGATASTVDLFDTYANQAKRVAITILNKTAPWLPQHLNAIAASPNPAATLVNYEGGPHWFHMPTNQPAPPALYDWMLNGYVESPEHANAEKKYLHHNAAGGVDLHAIFTDLSDKSISWTHANSMLDTEDLRYQMVASLNGSVPVTPKLVLPNVSGATFLSAPSSYPQTVATFDPALTYSILKGAEAGNYQITGNVLSMDAANGVDWAVPTSNPITILASNGFTDAIFEVTAVTGFAWYEGDARGALNMPSQQSPASLVLVRGGALAPLGVQGALVGGMLNLTGAGNYSSSTALTSNLTIATEPTLLLAVVAKGGPVVGSQGIVDFGSSQFCRLSTSTSTPASHLRWRLFGGADTSFPVQLWSETKQVFWAFFDPANNKAYTGRNQQVDNEQAHTVWTGNTLVRQLTLRAGTNPRIGSVEAVQRAGMTVSDVLAIVAKIQVLDNIP